MAKTFQLEQSMRWFGPNDVVSLRDIAQSGCTGVVSALHDIPVGEVWHQTAIARHLKLINNAGLQWTVVESLPVHEEIKTRSGAVEMYIEHYETSLRNLAALGVKVVTYNFMPVLDWVRTDLAYRLPNQSEALRFNRLDFVSFDLYMLQRPGAEKDYSLAEIARAAAHFKGMNEEQRQLVFKNAMLGLPGSEIPFTPEQILSLLDTYKGISREQLKDNLFHFLNEITPVAEELGIQLAIHPDDPPYSVLGLPRIMSTNEDVKDLMAAVPSKANGLCFCTGSFGARKDNDLLAMLQSWGARVYFLHLRNTKHDGEGNFFEANHLEGDADMFSLMTEIVQLMQSEGRSIPMRPDHGHKMLDDLPKTTYPGYSAIGRMKGLAELRGLEYAIQVSIERAAR
ncbi:MAG: mannonate dehydratase [Lewinella sp.]|uniref:mannonate dehydratase n=1 Tax=Lewinella sp. TaxID=2004506 RepID=UPI003D6C6BB6